MNGNSALASARRLAAEGQAGEACAAYTRFIRACGGSDPDAEMEAALYILQLGGDYKAAYDTFLSLYRRGSDYGPDCLNVMTEAFYLPNVEEQQERYEKNCALLTRYPYLFRRDFLPFDELPILFYPYDDNGYCPFYLEERRFGGYAEFSRPVVGRNFFADLEKPILAADVFSQYELEYLNDSVRKSEWVGRENHIYLHYTHWGDFCAHLQVLDLEKLLEDEKFVFLIEDEVGQYPIDFKERFGVDYNRYSVKPIGIREVNRMIWHTQFSAHNGGDFFNEIFDAHPNLLYMTSLMFDDVEATVLEVERMLGQLTAQEASRVFASWNAPWLVDELYQLEDRTLKDVLVAVFFAMGWSRHLDAASRIAPVLFFQPHFCHVVYSVAVYESGAALLQSEQYERICTSPLFKNFKYIKTFTPLRRFTTSHAATVRFSLQTEERDRGKREEITALGDTMSRRILNRSFMVDPQDRLFQDSVVVRFEDAKLNPKATFRALAAFVDLPYTESMTFCSFAGQVSPTGMRTDTVYNTYDEYTGAPERYFLEYFMRDAYAYYGYDFQYYDGAPMDEARVRALVGSFETLHRHNLQSAQEAMRESLRKENPGRPITEAEEELIRAESAQRLQVIIESSIRNGTILLDKLLFVNKNSLPLRMVPKLELDPALLEQPLYH